MHGCSRAVVLLVVYWAILCASANASRPQHWLEAVISGRSLQQDTSLSNSNGCLDTIPRCEANACATRNAMGTARWVCLRCRGTYESVVDASGQDNIIQCVCPKGTFENGTSCARCPADSYCPGGSKAENPTTRGAVVTCGTGLVTRNTGARTSSDCLAPAGAALTSPGIASNCSASTYAPMFNRLTKCLRCQGGLEEDPARNLTSAQRATKRVVCKVPPGRYMSQGLVRVCPQGFWRATYEDYDAAAAQACTACNPGITTAGAGSTAPANCSVVIQGHGIDNVTSVAAAAGLPALPQNADGLPTAPLCERAYYSAGGLCVQCPSGTVTVSMGSKAVEECVVPPGYFLPSAGSMTPCASGDFREGWLLQSDPKAATCTPCGEGIRSEPRDLDQNPLVADGSLTRATSASCYIEAGQGMVSQGRNGFAGRDCPANTYGVANTTWGLLPAPCKPCPRNMITEVGGSTGMDACINPAGFGYASEGASRCAPGFYSAKGSMKACTRCPEGRTTEDDPEKQQYIGQCNVAPGFGVANSSTVNLPASVVNVSQGLVPVSTISAADMNQITSGQCPTGFWGGGGQLLTTCTPCTNFFTTEGPGKELETDCNVCVAGRGVTNVGGTLKCELCEYGTYSPGFLRDCITCPAATFYAPIDGAGVAITSNGTTFEKGATSEAWCVPMESQLSPEAGQAYFGPSFLSVNNALLSVASRTNITSLEACIQSQDLCPGDKHCMAQYMEADKTCLMARFQPATDTTMGPQLFYKLPPSALSSASSVKGANSSSTSLVAGMATRRLFNSARPRPGSLRTFTIRGRASSSQGGASAKALKPGTVKASMLSSGTYARCILPDQDTLAWEGAGSPLGEDARTFVNNASAWRTVASVVECYELCDDSNVCWGGIFKDNKCLFRGGVDALRTRSFFVLADPGSATLGIDYSNKAYYYTISSSQSVAPLYDNPDAMTLLASAVAAALDEVSPYAYADGSIFTQTGNGTATSVEVGFNIVDKSSGSSVQSDLSSIFNGNATTLAIVARKLVETLTNTAATPAASAEALNLLYTGLYVFSSDGGLPIGAMIGTSILANGCDSIANYCGNNGNGACTLSQCGCKLGYNPPRCA